MAEGQDYAAVSLPAFAIRICRDECVFPPQAGYRPSGNLDRHGVHFLTAYVAGV